MNNTSETSETFWQGFKYGFTHPGEIVRMGPRAWWQMADLPSWPAPVAFQRRPYGIAELRMA